MVNDLFMFQADAVEELEEKLDNAALLYHATRGSQVISFTSATGSGKTVMMAALLERRLQEAPGTVVLWVSYSPELNQQSRDKIEAQANRIRVSQLRTIGEDFDARVLDDGMIYFVNAQKLGKNGRLVRHGDDREWTVWETLSNTVAEKGERFLVVIDEAHHGAQGTGNRERLTIMQKFVKGSPADGLPPMPVIIGMTATPARFEALVRGTDWSVHKVSIDPEDVRSSGLLKDRIIATHPDTQGSDLTLMRAAAEDWHDKCEHWAAYCERGGMRPVDPILLIQVSNSRGRGLTETDMDACLRAVEDALGRPLLDREVGHSFGEHTAALTTKGNREIRYVVPSRIEEDHDLKVVFFKTALSTGWDCPRAETMISFRTMNDPTAIAQLVGRMVRNPWRRRISVDDTLNSVELFLPRYDADAVKKVIMSLQSDEGTDGIVSSELRTSKEVQTATIDLDGSLFTAEMFRQAQEKPTVIASAEASAEATPATEPQGTQEPEPQGTQEAEAPAHEPATAPGKPDAAASKAQAGRTSPVIKVAKRARKRTTRRARVGNVERARKERSARAGAQEAQGWREAPRTDELERPVAEPAARLEAPMPRHEFVPVELPDATEDGEEIIGEDFDRQWALKGINDAELYTCSILKGRRRRSKLTSLHMLASFLSKSGLYPEALDEITDEIVQTMGEDIDKMKAGGAYARERDRLMQTRLRRHVYRVLDAEAQDIGASSTPTADAIDDIRARYREAERNLGDLGIADAYCRSREDGDDMTHQLELVIWTRQQDLWDELEKWAGARYHELLDEWRRKTRRLTEDLRREFDGIVKEGDKLSYQLWQLPLTVELALDDGGLLYRDHLYVVPTGSGDGLRCARIKLGSSWEREVLDEERAGAGFVCWLRNVDRKPWSVAIPYRDADGHWARAFPDLVVVRRDDDGEASVSLLEPHMPSAADNLNKAVGFARYAAEMDGLDRLELIRKDAGGYRRLDMCRSKVREHVLMCKTNEDLDRLFDRYGRYGTGRR